MPVTVETEAGNAREMFEQNLAAQAQQVTAEIVVPNGEPIGNNAPPTPLVPPANILIPPANVPAPPVTATTHWSVKIPDPEVLGGDHDRERLNIFKKKRESSYWGRPIAIP